MTRWPWITIVAAVLFALSPLRQDLYRGAFLSGEQLARNLSQFLLTIMVAIAAGLVMLEWLVRTVIVRRRARKGLPAAAARAPSDNKTER